jgi:hypothetical protein
MKDTAAIQQTYIDSSRSALRSDLDTKAFNRLIAEKGRVVTLHSAVLCPCKGRATAHKSTCKNCGGSGYAFINPRKVRMILQGMDVATKLVPWSEEARGMTSVSAMYEEEMCYMDKIVVEDAESIFCEVVAIDVEDSNRFARTAYTIKEVICAGVYVSDTVGYRWLTPSQYTIANGFFKLLDSAITADSDGEISITLRYKHAPAFHIIEFKRETMQSFKLTEGGKEENQSFPVHAYARRAHYQMAGQNLAGNRLIDNSYPTC